MTKADRDAIGRPSLTVPRPEVTTRRVKWRPIPRASINAGPGGVPVAKTYFKDLQIKMGGQR